MTKLNIQVGQKYYRKNPPNYMATCRVMAFVEGYVVARFPNAMPFLLWGKDFLEEFEVVPKYTEQPH